MQKWPKETTVRYTAVSAFVFLRLICPAIMNPKLFNMMPDHPTEEIARTLTLVAKVVQNLANMSEFGAKEPYMTPLNAFLQDQRPRMELFLDTLCKPGSAADDEKEEKKEEEKKGGGGEANDGG